MHHIPVGDVWEIDEINKRKAQVEEAGMTWKVIESLPVHEDIKKQTGNYKHTLKIINKAYAMLLPVAYRLLPTIYTLAQTNTYISTNRYNRIRNGIIKLAPNCIGYFLTAT